MMKERAKINTKRIGMATGILLIILFLFVIQIHAQVEKSVPVQENSIDKSAADKVKEDPPKIVKASEASVSKEEQSLVDQLIKARKAGNTNEVKNTEIKIAALHGRKLSYIKASDLKARETHTAPKANAPGKDPCITCNTVHESLQFLKIVHDQNNYLWTAVSDRDHFYVYRSTDNGSTWSLWENISESNDNPSVSSLAIAGNWLFVAVKIYPSTMSAGLRVYKISTINGSWDIASIWPGGDIVSGQIVTDYTEWPSNWWVYLVYMTSGGDIEFTKSIDQGASWSSSNIIASVDPRSTWSDHSLDYGGGYLHLAMTDLQYPSPAAPEQIDYIHSSNYGYSWSSKVSLTGIGDDSSHPTVAAVKSYSRGNGNVVIAYTRNWANSGDMDVWYAYSTDHGATWRTNHCLACRGSAASPVTEIEPAATASDNLGYIQAVYVKNTGGVIYGGQGFVYGSYTAYNTPGSLTSGVYLNSGPNATSPTITAKSLTAGVAWLNLSAGQVGFISW
jgi:hypothetical protein